jgi:hypothetical protein
LGIERERKRETDRQTDRERESKFLRARLFWQRNTALGNLSKMSAFFLPACGSQVQAALGAANDDELAKLCEALLYLLCRPGDSFSAMQLIDSASRDEAICKRLLACDSFRGGLEDAAGHKEEKGNLYELFDGFKCHNDIIDGAGATADVPASGPPLHCRAALRLLRARSTVRREQVLESAQGGTIRILENLAFGGQATCRGDGTLKTGGVVWATLLKSLPVQ